jgi:hypothetical protein
MPERCIFVQDIAIYILSLSFAILLGAYLRNVYSKINLPVIFEKLFFIVVGVLFFNIFTFNIKQNTTVLMINNIQNGQLNEYIQYEEGIIEEIIKSDELDVVVVRKSNERELFVMPIGLSENIREWPNGSIAKFFGKKSIKIQYN